MKIIFRNSYGAIGHVNYSFNPECKLQLIIDTIGIYMSLTDLKYLLSVVEKTRVSCTCKDCGNELDRIICKNSRIDLRLKINRVRLQLLEELIKETLFILEIENTLKINKIDTSL